MNEKPRAVVSLFGAYSRKGDPLSWRPLAVDLLLPRVNSLRSGGVRLAGLVRAEALARASPASVHFTMSRRALRCEVSFVADDAGVHEINLEPRFGRPILRTLTEVTGTLSASGDVLGVVRLRLNWRALSFWR